MKSIKLKLNKILNLIMINTVKIIFEILVNSFLKLLLNFKLLLLIINSIIAFFFFVNNISYLIKNKQ